MSLPGHSDSTKPLYGGYFIKVLARDREEEMGVLPDEPPIPHHDDKPVAIPSHLSASFKEEGNDLSDDHKECLSELRSQVRDDAALSASSIWGVSFLEDRRTDGVLLKFLRSRDFKVGEAFAMLRNTLDWRAQFGVDRLLSEEEELGGDDLGKAVFMHGRDRVGHPVCYNVYGEFQNKDVYERAFGDEEKRSRFLRWRIQFLERSIRKLDFWPGGVCTIFQVNDLKNSPGLGKKELRIAMEMALNVFQDNYPEFVAKQVFVNAPWSYLTCFAMISPFLTQRARSKFVFASPARTPEALFKYISPEQVPLQYGGLSVDCCNCEPEFTVADPATEITVKPGTKQIVEIIAYERCILVWELRVVGWEILYGAEFVPSVEGGFTVNIQKLRKILPKDEPVMRDNYKASKLGKVLLTVDNQTSKMKLLLYRFKIKPLQE